MAEEESGEEVQLQRALALAMARSMEHTDDPELTRALRVSRQEQKTRQHATVRSTDLNDDPELTRALRATMKEQRTRQQTTARSTDPNDNPELTRALRGLMEEQKITQQAMARNMDPNNEPELTRAIKALKEEQRTRQQAEGRENRAQLWPPRPTAARQRRRLMRRRRHRGPWLRSWPGSWETKDKWMLLELPGRLWDKGGTPPLRLKRSRSHAPCRGPRPSLAGTRHRQRRSRRMEVAPWRHTRKGTTC